MKWQIISKFDPEGFAEKVQTSQWMSEASKEKYTLSTYKQASKVLRNPDASMIKLAVYLFSQHYFWCIIPTVRQWGRKLQLAKKVATWQRLKSTPSEYICSSWVHDYDVPLVAKHEISNPVNAGRQSGSVLCELETWLRAFRSFWRGWLPLRCLYHHAPLPSYTTRYFLRPPCTPPPFFFCSFLLFSGDALAWVRLIKLG